MLALGHADVAVGAHMSTEDSTALSAKMRSSYASDLPVDSKPSVSTYMTESWPPPGACTFCGAAHSQMPLVCVARVWPTPNPLSAGPAPCSSQRMQSSMPAMAPGTSAMDIALVCKVQPSHPNQRATNIIIIVTGTWTQRPSRLLSSSEDHIVLFESHHPEACTAKGHSGLSQHKSAFPCCGTALARTAAHTQQLVEHEALAAPVRPDDLRMNPHASASILIGMRQVVEFRAALLAKLCAAHQRAGTAGAPHVTCGCRVAGTPRPATRVSGCAAALPGPLAPAAAWSPRARAAPEALCSRTLWLSTLLGRRPVVCAWLAVPPGKPVPVAHKHWLRTWQAHFTA